MKNFDIPEAYRSPLITAIKDKRKLDDKLKKDFTPTCIDFGKLKFYIARHFGFCYGVENAIEIVYRTIATHKDKKIYLLSEMIHNPLVNEDLLSLGVEFIMDTKGNQLIAWDSISNEDIVVIPAFGTTVEILDLLKEKGVNTVAYDTTCPFVEKVWKRAAKLGTEDYTIVIHGKASHEETRATFSHSKENSPAVVVQDLNEAKQLAAYITGDKPLEDFYTEFEGKFSDGFDAKEDLQNFGVVNQTTMLATDTQEISDYLKQVTDKVYGTGHFADTRDTLCYATSDNQNAVYGLLNQTADFAIVAGGYNSSNTSHLVELCEEKLDTYHIAVPEEIKSNNSIRSYKYRTKTFVENDHFLVEQEVTTILITSGASCPDAVVENIIDKIGGIVLGADFNTVKEKVLAEYF